MTKLAGRWQVGQSVDQKDLHTDVTWADGYGHTGVGAYAWGEGSTFRLGVTRPGMHALFYGRTPKGAVVWDQSAWDLTKRLKALGDPRGKVEQVPSGHVVTYQPRTGIFETREVEKPFVPEVQHVSREEASRQLSRIILEVAEEIYNRAGRPRVVAMLSGGTDSTLGTWALKEIGADVSAVTVGRSPDDFDPFHAARYAKQLGMDWRLLSLPTEDTALGALAYRAINAIESEEFSNTLMACCSTIVRDHMAELGARCMWHGYFADGLLGYSSLTIGAFKKTHAEHTDEAWARYRAGLYQHIIPNNMQVAQVSTYGDAASLWRTVFYHPRVMRFVWSMPISVVPLAMRKPLFAGVLDPHIRDGAWHSNKKWGYYSGSGISKIRLENPVLQDANLRRLFRMARGSRT